jgi:hypothetical protein
MVKNLMRGETMRLPIVEYPEIVRWNLPQFELVFANWDTPLLGLHQSATHAKLAAAEGAHCVCPA